jgi:hypothetical protein
MSPSKSASAEPSSSARTITLEEHYTTRDIQKAVSEFVPNTEAMAAIQAKLVDLGAGRIAAMDEGSVDVQVLSVGGLGIERLAAADVTALLHGANDELASATQAFPSRFAGFASLNLAEPEAAAKELERCVRQLGFKGALVNGLNGGAFLDDPRFTPIFEAAQSLQVPIYLHPAPPPKPVFDAYFTGLPGTVGQLLAIAGWGWHAELGLHVLRIIVSGLLDRFPEQQIIIGHMGEDLPFSLARAVSVIGGAAKHLERSVPEYFHHNFHVTTSGYFTLPPFLCALEVVGVDRLLYSVDYPYSPTTVGRSFLESLPVSPADRLKIRQTNAEALLKMRP